MNEKIHSILLVDWPSGDIPFALIQSGYTVYSYAPAGYTRAIIEAAPFQISRGHNVTASDSGSDTAKLVFQPMNHPPASVDLVAIYRPSEEHEEIIRNHVLPLGAKVIWLQPPVESMETMKMAGEQGLTFVQGRDIRELCR